MENENVMKTGTTTIGLVCKDGLVMAADRRATAGYMIANKKAEKVFPINDKMVITIAGNVSDAQLLTKLIKAELKLKNIRTGREVKVKEAANLLGGLVYSNIRRMSLIPGISHFLLGGMDKDGFHLYDLFADGSVTEVDDYVSSGSGSVFAYGVLETLYNKNLTVKEGVDLILKAINAALQRDIASGSGIDVVTVTKDGIKKVFEKELNIVIK
jgi:proteasome beta subunit